MGVVFSKTQAPLLDFEYYTEWQKQQKSKANKEHCKDWRERNRQWVKEYAKEYNLRNKDYIKARNKEYYENNSKHAEYMKEYFERNRDYIKEYYKEYRIKNKERMNEYAKNYRQRMKNGEAGGEKAECPLCKRWFVLTKCNQLRKHKCLP